MNGTTVIRMLIVLTRSDTIYVDVNMGILEMDATVLVRC